MKPNLISFTISNTFVGITFNYLWDINEKDPLYDTNYFYLQPIYEPAGTNLINRLNVFGILKIYS